MARKIVHVVGTGTIGEPLIGLLCDFKDSLGIDEVTFHKNSAHTTDRSKVKNLIKRGARLTTQNEKIDGFNNIQAMYNQWNFWIVFTAGFTPIPFKLITISAGTFNINFLMFLIASIISRSARFFIVASLIKVFGDPIKEFIEKYFNLLALIFTILLIGGFIFIKYILP